MMYDVMVMEHVCNRVATFASLLLLIFQGNTALHVAYMNSNLLVADVILRACEKKGIDMKSVRNKVS